MPRHLLAQISDVHLSTRGTLPPGAKPSDNLRAAVSRLAAARLRPDVWVLTGDLADRGEPACYDELAAVLNKAADGAAVVYMPGNHDARGPFRERLLGEPAGEGPINQVRWHGGLRLIALDSTVPGEDHGRLDEETLTFLADELASPAPDGTIVALHHPPIPSPIAPMARQALRDPRRFASAIADTDVRLVICGHNHHESLGTLGGVPVWVGPATVYRADVTSRDVFRPTFGNALSLVDLDDAGPVVSVVQAPSLPTEGPAPAGAACEAGRSAHKGPRRAR